MTRGEKVRRDRILLSRMVVECIVGVRPEERAQTQPLEVEIELGLPSRRRVRRLGETVDYALVANQVAFLLENARFFLLETAARAIASLLLAPPAPSEWRSPVEAVRVKLTKPMALGGKAIPSVEILREQGDFEYLNEVASFGKAEVIYEAKGVGIYRLHVAPGKAIPLHVHHQMEECEMVVTDGFLLNGRRVEVGEAYRWPKGFAHGYDNKSDHWATILCIDSPKFIREDEIEVRCEPTMPAPEWRWRWK
ncbi:MAG: dihydroneopterin aldolase [Deltaproteobacteria bacterium]|nr:dihydroneopterin aldolase [Deltaproteobacteria bacterium]